MLRTLSNILLNLQDRYRIFSGKKNCYLPTFWFQVCSGDELWKWIWAEHVSHACISSWSFTCQDKLACQLFHHCETELGNKNASVSLVPRVMMAQSIWPSTWNEHTVTGLEQNIQHLCCELRCVVLFVTSLVNTINTDKHWCI